MLPRPAPALHRRLAKLFADETHALLGYEQFAGDLDVGLAPVNVLGHQYASGVLREPATVGDLVAMLLDGDPGGGIVGAEPGGNFAVAEAGRDAGEDFFPVHFQQVSPLAVKCQLNYFEPRMMASASGDRGASEASVLPSICIRS